MSTDSYTVCTQSVIDSQSVLTEYQSISGTKALRKSKGESKTL